MVPIRVCTNVNINKNSLNPYHPCYLRSGLKKLLLKKQEIQNMVLNRTNNRRQINVIAGIIYGVRRRKVVPM